MIQPMLAETLEFPFSSGFSRNGKWHAEKFPKNFHAWDFLSTWWFSQKLDGVRALWDGKVLRTRTGNIIPAPKWFTAQLPKDAGLDGELFGGPGTFPATNGTVQRKKARDEDWRNLRYCVFDAADPKWLQKPFRARYAHLEKLLSRTGPNVALIPHQPVVSPDNLYRAYQAILHDGGEGVVLRNPDAAYSQKRSKDLLKLKPNLDAEAVVLGYNEGKGSNAGYLGTFAVEMLDPETRKPNGVRFQLSGRMNHEFRRQYQYDAKRRTWTHVPKSGGNVYPTIGSVVTFEYMTLSAKGVPRQPIFIRLRK